MQTIFRAISLSSLCACIALFGLLAYGQFVIPDRFVITQEDAAQIGLPFVASSKQGAQLATGQADGSVQEYTYDLDISVMNLFPVKKSKVTVSQRRYVVAGGSVFGIKLYAKGVVIVGIDNVTTDAGTANPAAKAGLKEGDIILAIDGKAITRNKEVSAAVEKSNGRAMQFYIERDGKEMMVEFYAAKSSQDGKWKAGMWVRDSSAGIGTLTFYDPKQQMFAGLGHAVCDVDTGETIPISGGEAVQADVNGCYKGSNGKPGELCGVFLDNVMGTLMLNGNTGVYGTYLHPDRSDPEIPVALRQEVQTGPAQIIATIEGQEPDYYDIEIVKVYQNENTNKKNMVIQVTDETLLEATGGIVQGMSGSPIIQNGMLAGAVTHVFVNNPQQGYAIFAQSMLETVDTLTQQQLQNAS